MRRAEYLVCYDISDEKRLAKLAKYLEKFALRVQYSVFLYKADNTELDATCSTIKEIIDAEEDDVRIYRIDPKRAITIGAAFDLSDPMSIF